MSLSIGILYGGDSSEREISIKTGNSVASALKYLGHKVTLFDAKPGFETKLKEANLDLAFISLHGSPGEDGIIQGLLEFMNIPYTGSKVAGSAIAMDKLISKKLFLQADLKTPNFISINREELKNRSIIDIYEEIVKKMGLPVVIKPYLEGSSVGLRIPKNLEQLKDDLTKSMEEMKPFIIEEYIKGQELTVGILGNPANPLPIVEIVPKSGVFDFKAKYTKGETEYIVPAPLDSDLTKIIQKMAVEAFNLLDCKDFGRVDFMLCEKQIPYILEVNTIPGMTGTSLLPKAASAIGMGFNELCEMIIELSLKE